MSSRREFIRKGCEVCTSSLGLGILLATESCNTNAHVYRSRPVNGRMEIPLAAFRDKKLLIVRPKAFHYEILLVKKSATEIKALLLKCTHRAEPLDVKKNFIHCSAHGSAFDFEGNVLSVPAKHPLGAFPAVIDGNSVILDIRS